MVFKGHRVAKKKPYFGPVATVPDKKRSAGGAGVKKQKTGGDLQRPHTPNRELLWNTKKKPQQRVKTGGAPKTGPAYKRGWVTQAPIPDQKSSRPRNCVGQRGDCPKLLGLRGGGIGRQRWPEGGPLKKARTGRMPGGSRAGPNGGDLVSYFPQPARGRLLWERGLDG